MTIAYSIIFALSLLMPVGYYTYVRKAQSEPWLLILNVSVCIVNLGYLLLSFSKTVEFALFANKVAYLGQVFVPLSMFMIISRLSGFVYKRWIRLALACAALLMYSLVLTTGHLGWYYKSVELTFADGAAKLIKEYGPLHPVNLIYVLVYFVAMFVAIGLSMRQRRSNSHKLAGLMLAVVLGNIGMWVVEKLIPLNFEFLSVSYLMSEFVFFFVYWMLQDYVHKNDLHTYTQAEKEKLAVQITEMTMEAKLAKVLTFVNEDNPLSMREREILEMVIAGKKRREIADKIHLSENTVKTYTRTLYGKLGISCREELYELLLQNNG